ncbi:MAG: adenosylcobalamin-dependent ribonucleoside-diphosphate reductase [Gammaproteobacteria bacterium]|nr:adenosylcobalamin-dependent ribonucleoside-diphosphate reductase [Gammaproteobacteria bacterium]
MQQTSLSKHIWESRYRVAAEHDREADITDTWARVANAVAEVEADQTAWQRSFYRILEDFRFLPGGRILAGAGTENRVTLFNCFVMGTVVDSIEGIFNAFKEAAITMEQGGGIGFDFSTLRPSGTAALRSGMTASGPLSFMFVLDSICDAMLASSARRGAIMMTLRCDHPDIEQFINVKRRRDALRNFNLSVLITDAFMQAVADDAEWQLHFESPSATDQIDNTNTIIRALPAREIWRKINVAAHDCAEPGVLFVDRINSENNLAYCEVISATNPCGEVPLPPYGACCLGSINLTAFVRDPFTQSSSVDESDLRKTVAIAVRFLDNVIDISHYPLPSQAKQARATRRIGLGITGLADMLVMLGLHYDSAAARRKAAQLMRIIRDVAYASSIDLAKEKGRFELFDAQKYLRAPFVSRLPNRLQDEIASNGMRNSHLLAIAPTGTVSLLANNISSGIEPIYSLEAERAVRDRELKMPRFLVRDYAYSQWRENGHASNAIPDTFVTTDALPGDAHLRMQAEIQPFVDNAISKTVNLPDDASVDDVAAMYQAAYTMGVKGCTVYRTGSRRGQVLRDRDKPHCCDIDREAD